MTPRFITPLEQEYSKTFPGNPALLFYVEGGEQEKVFRQRLKEAVRTHAPLTQEDILDFWGDKAYEREREYLEEFLGMEIKWS